MGDELSTSLKKIYLLVSKPEVFFNQTTTHEKELESVNIDFKNGELSIISSINSYRVRNKLNPLDSKNYEKIISELMADLITERIRFTVKRALEDRKHGFDYNLKDEINAIVTDYAKKYTEIALEEYSKKTAVVVQEVIDIESRQVVSELDKVAAVKSISLEMMKYEQFIAGEIITPINDITVKRYEEQLALQAQSEKCIKDLGNKIRTHRCIYRYAALVPALLTVLAIFCPVPLDVIIPQIIISAVFVICEYLYVLSTEGKLDSLENKFSTNLAYP